MSPSSLRDVAKRFFTPRPLARALALAGVGAVADGLHTSGLSGPADFALRLREPLPRGLASLVLALATVGRLGVWRGHFDTLSRLLPSADFLSIALRSPRRLGADSARFTVGDDPDVRGTEGRVLLDYDYFNPGHGNGTVVAPFPLHPHFYKSGLHRTLASYRGGPRAVRLFFAGTSESASYSQSFAADLFAVMTRAEMISAVIEDFPDEVLVVRRREQVSTISRSGRPIVLVLTDRTDDRLDKHLLGPREYLRLRSDSAFALCPPGWAYPHCHNLIESLAVGSVPVLGYASYCHPPLTGGVNCLTFADRDGLRSAVRAVLSLSDAEVATLGAAAAGHYDRELSLAAFADRLTCAIKAGGDVRVRFPFDKESLQLRRAHL